MLENLRTLMTETPPLDAEKCEIPPLDAEMRNGMSTCGLEGSQGIWNEGLSKETYQNFAQESWPHVSFILLFSRHFSDSCAIPDLLKLRRNL